MEEASTGRMKSLALLVVVPLLVLVTIQTKAAEASPPPLPNATMSPMGEEMYEELEHQMSSHAASRMLAGSVRPQSLISLSKTTTLKCGKAPGYKNCYPDPNPSGAGRCGGAVYLRNCH